MPGYHAILAGLGRIANEAFAIAIAWHVVVALCVIALLLGARPPRRVAATLLSAPLASVSALAWLYGNPFNGAVFAVLAIVLAWLARREPRETEAQPQRGAWSLGLGWALIAFAWVYPHFLERSAWAYLYGAPLGTIPCPTLALVMGATLLSDRLVSRAFRTVLASVATFYAVFGVVRLGVSIDLVLLVGAVALFVREPWPRPRLAV